MGSKRFRREICVYCNQRPAVTGDHVFAREFFLLTERGDLPQAPTCERCNAKKSSLEHYLTTVLPFGGAHADGHQNLVEMVPRRLARNAKLQQSLHAGRTHIWHMENGVIRWSMTIPIDAQKVTALGRYIAQGLAWYHWNVRLEPGDTSGAWLLSSVGRAAFDRFFAMNAEVRIRQDLGKGTVHYEGVQARDNPRLTLWRIKFYGGLQLVDDPNTPLETSGEIGAITGPKRLVSMLERVATPHE